MRVATLPMRGGRALMSENQSRTTRVERAKSSWAARSISARSRRNAATVQRWVVSTRPRKSVVLRMVFWNRRNKGRNERAEREEREGPVGLTIRTGRSGSGTGRTGRSHDNIQRRRRVRNNTGARPMGATADGCRREKQWLGRSRTGRRTGRLKASGCRQREKFQ